MSGGDEDDVDGEDIRNQWVERIPYYHSHTGNQILDHQSIVDLGYRSQSYRTDDDGTAHKYRGQRHQPMQVQRDDACVF